MKTIINIIHPAFAAFALGCFAVCQTARAVSPAPDGCYPNYTTAEGCNALRLLTTGAGNTGVGWGSLQSDINGNFNTGLGAGALLLNNADSNTAVGAVALLLNTTGHDNTAIGQQALLSNTGGSGDQGSFNTATGAGALYSNTTGQENTANGWQALYSNTTGWLNVATGVAALTSNTTGNRNTAIGNTALWLNTEGFRNTATGFGALQINTTGNFNATFGWSSLIGNETGSLNTALGAAAGAYVAGDNNIDVGTGGDPADANTIRIGVVTEYTDTFGPNLLHPAHTATYIAGISGTPVTGDAVVVDANGQLGTAMSSARFKREIKPMDDSSEAILALKPVTFRYKHEIDPKGIPQFGLVAEEVEKVNPDLVSRDRDGKAYTVRYEAVNAMLLNEFLKEHHQLQDLKEIVADQQKQIKALTSGLQKVGAQVQLSKFATGRIRRGGPAPQTVVDNQ